MQKCLIQILPVIDNRNNDVSNRFHHNMSSTSEFTISVNCYASKFTNMINLKQHFAPEQLDIDVTYKVKLAL